MSFTEKYFKNICIHLPLALSDGEGEGGEKSMFSLLRHCFACGQSVRTLRVGLGAMLVLPVASLVTGEFVSHHAAEDPSLALSGESELLLTWMCEALLP